MKDDTENEISFGTKLAIWCRYTTVALITALTIQGAVSMTQKQWVQVAMGSQAIASESITPKKETVEDLAIPKEMPEAIDAPSDGKARCLGNAKNDSQKARCHALFAKKSDAQFSEVY